MGPVRRTARRVVRRRSATAIVVAAAAVLVGCSDEGDGEGDARPTTTETPTTAPIPTPGGQAIELLDACGLIADERLAVYLDEIGAPAVVSTSADATEIASVCGWFVEDREEVDRADRVLIRVEPIQEDGNVVCDPPEFTDSDPLSLDEGDGWATSAAPVETASIVGEWCVYLAAPEGADDVATTRDATAELLAEVQATLPR